MMKILSIDDHPLFYEGLKSILEKDNKIELINGYRVNLDYEKFIQSTQPNLILLDIHLHGKSGISLAKEFKTLFPTIKIIILSMEINVIYQNELAEIGVEAYISKEMDPENILEIIQKIHQGETHYSEQFLNSSNRISILSNDFKLTEREIQIYQFVKKGYTNLKIAELLHLSEWTIKTHRKNIKQKLNVKSGYKLPQDSDEA